MQYKIYTIPLITGFAETDEMNLFLRQHKIVDVAKQLVTCEAELCWTFCITYLDGAVVSDPVHRQKIDYRKELDAVTYERFCIMRRIRKTMAEELAIPAYSIFTDAEMAEVAKLPELTTAKVRSIQGIGDGKIERYFDDFIRRFDSEIAQNNSTKDAETNEAGRVPF